MTTYKIFKKNSSKLKILSPLSNGKLKVGKLIDCDEAIISYSEDGEMYLEIAQCPRIYVGMELVCKNIEFNRYEEVGKLVDLQYNDDIGYLFIFE